MLPEVSIVGRLLPDFVAAAATIAVVILFLKHLRSIATDAKTAVEIQSKVFMSGLEMVLAESKRATEAIVVRLQSLEYRQDKSSDAIERVEQLMTTRRMVDRGMKYAKDVVDPKNEG